MPRELSLTALKAVLFDIDGTLVDSLGMLIHGLGDTYERFSGTRPPDDEIRKLMGLPLRKQLIQFTDEPPSQEQLDQMFQYALQRFDAHQHRERVFEQSVQALKECKRAGLGTALVTSKSQEELGPFLDRFSGAAYVDATVCASDVVNSKPHPESALLACNKLGTDPSETLLIGDSVYDLQCGHGAGCLTLAVSYGSTSESELLAESPIFLARTPRELLEWVSTRFLDPICHEPRN